MPRDVASRAAKEVCDEGRGVGPGGYGVYLDFRDAIGRLGLRARRRRSTATSSRCTSGSPARTRYQVPMRIYPAVHYTMGGLWVDYHLMSTIPGLFVGGEANFSDQGANRLGASALCRAWPTATSSCRPPCPTTWPRRKLEAVDASHPAFREAEAEVRRRTALAAGGQGPADGGLVSTASWAS